MMTVFLVRVPAIRPAITPNQNTQLECVAFLVPNRNMTHAHAMQRNSMAKESRKYVFEYGQAIVPNPKNKAEINAVRLGYLWKSTA